MGLQALALVAAAKHALLARRLPRPLRRWLGAVAGALNAAAVALNLDIARSAVVPGANDNASGVAAVLDLARAIAADPLGARRAAGRARRLRGERDGRHVAPGSRARPDLAPRTDARAVARHRRVGHADRRPRRGRRAHAPLPRARPRAGRRGRGARGLPAPQRWRIGAWTDPLVALRAGLPAISLLSIGPGYYPHYHHPSDLPEHVDWASVAACARIAHGDAARARPPHGAGPR